MEHSHFQQAISRSAREENKSSTRSSHGVWLLLSAISQHAVPKTLKEEKQNIKLSFPI